MLNNWHFAQVIEEHMEHHHPEPNAPHAGHGVDEKHDGHADHGHAAHGGHAGHGAHHAADYKKRFVISTAVTIPVLLISPTIQDWFGFSISFPGDKYVLATLATFIFLYGGHPFLKGLREEVQNKAIGMMTLIGIAIAVSWAYSLAVTFGLEGMDFYWEMATLIDIMLIGHYFEMKSVMGASRSLELLVKMMPATAHRIAGDEVREVPVEDLEIGDRLLVKPGEKIPVDGMVREGDSHLDESMLTGESKPVKKEKGGEVIGGSINGNGSLTVEVTSTGKDSYLTRIVQLVEDAQKVKSRSQHFADQAAKILTFVALGGGMLTLAVWLILGHPFVFALERMVTVMVITCPHALGLAVPLVVAISTSVSAQNGLLIRNRTAFENSRLITTVIFDKTGTLTEGSHELQHIGSLDDRYPEEELLRLGAGVEQHSEHYIARGMLRKAKELGVEVPKSVDFNYLPGKGVEGTVEGRKIRVVGPNVLKEEGLSVAELKDHPEGTTVYVVVDQSPVGYFSFADKIREDAHEAIETLSRAGIKNLLLTGDNANVAKEVSDALDMDGYFAQVLPHEKLEKVQELQEGGEFVAMAGDGVNDAPALAQADVGIAVGSGTDVAAETADIILVNSNPKDIARLIMFGKATYRKMVQNLWWAAGYNIVAIPLAAGVLYNWGFMLDPAVGAVLMSLSTIIVAFNAQRLKREMK